VTETLKKLLDGFKSAAGVLCSWYENHTNLFLHLAFIMRLDRNNTQHFHITLSSGSDI